MSTPTRRRWVPSPPMGVLVGIVGSRVPGIGVDHASHGRFGQGGVQAARQGILSILIVAPPTWTVSDPLALEIAPNGELKALRGGDLEVAASVAGIDVETRLRINPRSVRLAAPVIYLN